MSDEGRAFVKLYSPHRGSTFWLHFAFGDMANAANDYEIRFGDKWLLGEWPGLTPRSVKRGRGELIESGHIEVVDAAHGPGRPSIYRFVFVDHEEMMKATGAKKVPVQKATGAKRVPEQGPKTTEQGPNASIAPYIETEELKEVTAKRTPSAVVPLDGADYLCELLVRAIAHHRGDTRAAPSIKANWRKDMEELLAKGPRERLDRRPLSRDAIKIAIVQIFTVLNVRTEARNGRAGFCWADQVQAPSALLNKWDKIATALNATLGTRVSVVPGVTENDPSMSDLLKQAGA